jgi:hypothetical protein
MRYILSITLLAVLTLFVSCSDDSGTAPDKTECRLMSFTDSANYFYELEYDQGELYKLLYYKFANGTKNQLLRTITINRNFFGEIIYIESVNKDNILEGIDSVFMDSKGYINEIVHYNSNGVKYGREARDYNERGLVVEEKSYKLQDEWELASIQRYEYDEKERVTLSIFELFTESGSNIDTTSYTYDNMQNIESKTDIFTVFTVNNKLTATSKYTLHSGTIIEETKQYEYEYNQEGYPTKLKITSLLNPEDVKYKYFNFDCP